jgi:uncharacterized membrane protein
MDSTMQDKINATTHSVESQTEDTSLQSLKNITTAVYALQAASFLVGITFLVALIINYVKRPDVAGTYLESHFTWQIRTFWYGLLWGVLGFITVFILIGYFILLANTVWILYRVIKGWLRLFDGQPAYA